MTAVSAWVIRKFSGDIVYGEVERWSQWEVDSFDGTAVDAVEFAREYARTHASGIGVPLHETPDGATFDTTNGSRVAYRAIRMGDTDG